jgi:hypothetical protein
MSTPRLAAGLGVAAEVVLCGCFMAYGGFGPCGPTNELSGFVLMFHLPGIWLAQHLPLFSGILFIPLALVSGAMTFGVLFAIPIAVGRRLAGRA